MFVGLIVSSVASLVLDPFSTKISTRNVEKARKAVLKSMSGGKGTVRVGLKRRNVRASDDPSSLQQGQHEFNLMRMIQSRAALSNAILALGLVLLLVCVIWFIGAVVFWQAQQYTTGTITGTGVSWTYFEALYFTYVSFLTIGYGDFYPSTPSAKPAFVLWSLIALPTLTVLIGAVGGTISTAVSTATLWVAEHLPAKTQTLANMKATANKMKKSDGAGHTEAKPADFEANAGDGEGSEGEGGPAVDSATAPLLCLRQLRTVVGHVNASPPRKYSFDEWTWILKLLGEEQGKGRPGPGDQHGDAKKQAGVVGKANWSWLDRESPLMSGMDEPQWVLGKLLDVLEDELQHLADAGRKAGATAR